VSKILRSGPSPEGRGVPTGGVRTVPPILASATVRVPATCGELVQGTRAGVSFHVTCPIDLYSLVTVELMERPGVECPPDSPKAGAGVAAALRRLGADVGARVTVRSPIPRSKGLGSSTADVAGAIAACALALGRPLPPDEIARLALSVEPTDGSVFPGIVLFDHRRGDTYEWLGEAPAMSVVMLDGGGEVDTVAFNRVDRASLLRSLEPEHVEALALVRRGLATGDPALIGRGATLSALANQRILPKPELPRVLDAARQIGAAGVCVGHSGTVIGVLLDARAHDVGEAAGRLVSALPDLPLLGCQRIVSGGTEFVGP
jgi:L-threonine kinase